ncbi:MAG: TonB family protein [Deltaproteobacteria bacterium]|nr:TonB family protein [Deltaproteobacteria bacterium]
MKAKSIPQGLKRLMLGSLALHVSVGVILAAVLGHAHDPAPKNVVVTKLVRLGKKRPDDMLPRLLKEKPPAPAAKKPPVKKVEPKPKPAEKVIPIKKPDAPKQPKAKKEPPKENALDRARKMNNVSSALDRLRSAKGEEEAEGDPKGSQKGTVSDLSLAILGNKYMTEISDCLQSVWNVEGLSESQTAGLSAKIGIWVSSRGKFVRHQIEGSSGVAAFDRAVEKAVQKCGGVSAPPSAIRKVVGRDGIEIVFRP